MKNHEEGFALTTSLALAAVAMIVGLSAVQSSKLEETMAGNFNSSTKAFFSSEYGGAKVWEAVDQSSGDLDDLVSGMTGFGGSPCVEWEPSPDAVNSYYKICYDSSDPAYSDGLNKLIRVFGAVYSGDANDGGAMVAERELIIDARIKGLGFGRLSPFNSTEGLEYYEGATSQAEYEGDEETEEYDGTPAISAGSKEEALMIVEDILKLSPGEESDKYTFVPDVDEDGNVDESNGVYYASPTVNADGAYTGDYSSCSSGPNRLCNYKGGIATRPAEEILGQDAGSFHDFMSTLYSDASHYSSIPENVDGVAVVTSESFVNSDGDYFPERQQTTDADGNEVTEYPERDVFEGPGQFSGEGVLVIDGDVEFNGDPGFEGMIIVLGSYTVKGGGGSDFTGAIVSAPYSCLQGENPSCGFDPNSVDLSGGGGNDYIYSQSVLDDAWQELAAVSPEAAEIWFIGNNPEGTHVYIASGWSEVGL